MCRYLETVETKCWGVCLDRGWHGKVSCPPSSLPKSPSTCSQLNSQPHSQAARGVLKAPEKQTASSCPVLPCMDQAVRKLASEMLLLLPHLALGDWKLVIPEGEQSILGKYGQTPEPGTHDNGRINWATGTDATPTAPLEIGTEHTFSLLAVSYHDSNSYLLCY